MTPSKRCSFEGRSDASFEEPWLKVQLKIQRFDPATQDKPVWGTYVADVDDNARVLDALHYVKWYVDGKFQEERTFPRKS